MNWKTKSTGNSDVFKFKNVGDRIEGVFMGSSMVSLPGMMPFKTFQVQPEGKGPISFSSNYQLEKCLGEMVPGATVRITFNGQRTSKRGNRFNDFTIEVEDTEAA